MTGEPELPPVMSRSERKLIGSSPPSALSAYGPYCLAVIASSWALGASNGFSPVAYLASCAAVVNGQSASAGEFGLNDFTVP